MAVLLGAGEHVHQLMRDDSAESLADELVGPFEIVAMQAGAHKGADAVAGHFAERLHAAVGFKGGGEGADFAQLVIERRRRQFTSALEAHDYQVGERGVDGFVARFPVEVHAGVLEDALGFTLHGFHGLRGVGTVEIEDDG